MNCKGQGKGAIIGLVAVIVIAGYFVIRQISPQRYTPPNADWACEECDHRFVAPIQIEPRECPRCPGEAVRTYMYYDTARNELIELYREKPHPDAHPEMIEEDLVVKVPGGEWMEPDPRIEAEYGFPVPVENPEDLQYAPPGSEYR